MFVASEEAAIRVMEPDAENIWAPRGRRAGDHSSEGRCLLMGDGISSIPNLRCVRNESRCIACRVCERQCANEVHRYDEERGRDDQRREQMRQLPALRRALSDAGAEDRKERLHLLRENANWQQRHHSRKSTSRPTAAACCFPPWATRSRCPVYWDRLLINASQVTNPSIDPLREPMETRVFLGKKPERIQRDENGRHQLRPAAAA